MIYLKQPLTNEFLAYEITEYINQHANKPGDQVMYRAMPSAQLPRIEIQAFIDGGESGFWPPVCVITNSGTTLEIAQVLSAIDAIEQDRHYGISIFLSELTGMLVHKYGGLPQSTPRKGGSLTDDEKLALVQKYLSVQGKETQVSFCIRNLISVPTLGNYMRYLKAKGLLSSEDS